MNRDQILADPLSAIQSLSATEIEERLEELDRQAAALRVLLRSARRRQQPEKRQPRQADKGVAHAS
jgi:hypothetical protein